MVSVRTVKGWFRLGPWADTMSMTRDLVSDGKSFFGPPGILCVVTYIHVSEIKSTMTIHAKN